MAVSRILMSDKPVTKISRFSANICKCGARRAQSQARLSYAEPQPTLSKWDTPCFISFFADFCLPPLTHCSSDGAMFYPSSATKPTSFFSLACRMCFLVYIYPTCRKSTEHLRHCRRWLKLTSSSHINTDISSRRFIPKAQPWYNSLLYFIWYIWDQGQSKAPCMYKRAPSHRLR